MAGGWLGDSGEPFEPQGISWTVVDGSEQFEADVFYDLSSAARGLIDFNNRDHAFNAIGTHDLLLTQHEGPDAVTTTYGYDTYNGVGDGPFMTSITTSDGEDASFTYDTQHRIHTMTLSDETLTFAYNTPTTGDCATGTTTETVVTYDNGDHDYFCSDADFTVTDQWNDVEPDMGDGDDGVCTPPAEDSGDADCGASDTDPAHVYDEGTFSTESVPANEWGIADDTNATTQYNVFGQPLLKQLTIRRIRLRR